MLECDNQKEAVWKEEDFTAGAAQLRIAISKRPVDKPSLLVNLGNIEGMGLPSAAIDCGAVVTVYADKHKISSLSLQDCLDIYSAFRGPVAIKVLPRNGLLHLSLSHLSLALCSSFFDHNHPLSCAQPPSFTVSAHSPVAPRAHDGDGPPCPSPPSRVRACVRACVRA